MFDGIIGNDNIKKELSNIVTLNKLSHSYLFIGTEGIGKKNIASEFAKMILCLNEKKYCNLCKSCIEFNSGNHPDFEIIVPDGTSIKIEQIRKMQQKIVESPIISEKKVYIIDDADLMTKEAQNCLLKTLEEPPEYVIIILIGSIENNFLSTIKSRCTIIKFKDISNENIKEYMQKKYNINDLSDNMLKIIGGSIGKAEKLKEKNQLYESVINIVENITRLDLIEFLKKSDEIYKNQEDKFDILENMNVCFFSKAKEDIRFLKCIDVIEETRKRLLANGNFNMCIDNMLFNLWEELH